MALLTASGVILRSNPLRTISFSEFEVGLLYRAIVKPVLPAGTTPGRFKSVSLMKRALRYDTLRQALERSHGDIRKAAIDLGISRATIYRRLKSFQQADA
jgi:transcriptional regulator of acetoin/glycerol metabolism